MNPRRLNAGRPWPLSLPGGTELLLVLLVAAGCAAGRNPHRLPGSGALEASTARARAFWRAHGGPEAWREHAAVTFSYEVTSLRDGENGSFAEVAFRIEDYDHLWIRREPAGALDRIDLTRDFELPRSPALGCALALVRYLFSVPLATSRGSWELRQLLAPPDINVPDLLEVVPLAASSPLGACSLEQSDATGLLSRVTYFPRHLFARGEVRRVQFSGYTEVGGVKVALVRESELFRERLSNVRFLGAREADALLPLPDPGASAAPSAPPRSGAATGATTR